MSSASMVGSAAPKVAHPEVRAKTNQTVRCITEDDPAVRGAIAAGGIKDRQTEHGLQMQWEHVEDGSRVD
jgi:hypothetical protein